MKIVHVIEPLAGGMVTFMKSLTGKLSHDTHLIVHGTREHNIPLTDVKKKLTGANVKFILWQSARRSLCFKQDLRAFFELYTILKRLRDKKSLDVVHLHCSKGGFLGRVACRLLGLQDVVVYTPNGAPFLTGSNVVSNYLYKKLEKLASLFGGQIVCCSPSEQEAYLKAGMKAVIINNGIQYNKIIPPRKSRHADGTFRVVTTGRIVDQKDPILFNKIASYFEEFKKFKFQWIGDGELRHLLTAKNIEVTGWLSKEAVTEIVEDADVYISTALFEGLSFAALEALSLNKPVLLTDCIGNKDLTDGLNGAVFCNENEAINKILQFYNNASMLNVMGEHSGSYCKTHFNLEDTFNRYKKLYQQASFVHSLSYHH